MIRVKHRNLELWDSIDFIAHELGEFEVILEGEGETIEWVFDFRSDSGEKERQRQIIFEVVSPQRLKCVCVNWDDHIPVTLKEIISLGDFLGKRFWVVFSVNKLGSTGELRQVHFSVYLQEKGDGEEEVSREGRDGAN